MRDYNKERKEREENKIKHSRFIGWTTNKLILRANKIISIINDEGLKNSDINILEETFELIISRLKVINRNDNDLIDKRKELNLGKLEEFKNEDYNEM